MAFKSDTQLIARNSIFLYLRLFAVLIIKLFTTRVIVNSLGFEDFGIYNVVASVVIFCSFITSALNNSTNRYIAYEIGAGDNESTNKVYTMALNCHIILASVLFVVIGVIGFWFVNNHLVIEASRLVAANWLFLFSITNLFFSIVQVPYNACIIANEKMDFYAIVSIFEVVFQLIIAFLLIHFGGDKLILYGFLLLLVNVGVFLANKIYSNYKFKDIRYVKKYWEAKLVKKFASYSGWSLLVNAADATSEQSLSIFFNWFIGVIGNAALAINNQVNSALHYFTNGVLSAFKPQIIKSYAAGDKNYFMKLIYTSSKLSYVFLVAAVVPLVLNIEFILKLWLRDYPSYAPAFIKVTIIYYIFDIYQMPLVYAVHATGNLKVHQIVVGFIKLSAIPLSYITLKLGGGGTGALFVWSLLNIVCAAFRTIYMRNLISMNLKEYTIKVIVPIVIFTLLLLPLPYIVSLYVTGWSCLIASSMVSVMSTIVLGYVVVLDSSEKQIFKKLPIISKFIKK